MSRKLCKIRQKRQRVVTLLYTLSLTTSGFSALEEEEDEEESNEMNSDEDVDSVLTDEKAMHKRKRDALNEY